MSELREELNKKNDKYYVVVRRIEVDEKGRKIYYLDSIRPATKYDLIRYGIKKYEP